MTRKTIFITGGAKRIGAVTAKYFHDRDYNIVLHYNNSEGEAHKLTEELNKLRENSCFKIKADFSSDSLFENLTTFYNSVESNKPSGVKGKYVKKLTICSTMGPGINVDFNTF
jgi:NAD(P)-dependent dehydrogenase (short-subunit alcohol dehydrogenase family)